MLPVQMDVYIIQRGYLICTCIKTTQGKFHMLYQRIHSFKAGIINAMASTNAFVPAQFLLCIERHISGH